MGDRVLHEVGEKLGEEVGVAPDRQAGLDRGGHRVAGIDRHLAVDVGDPLGDVRKVERAESLLARARVELGDAQKRVEGLDDGVAFGHRRLDARSSSALSRVRPIPSRPWRRRASGVRRSWAMSVETCRRLSTSVSMRASMTLMSVARRSSSSPRPDTAGAGRAGPPRSSAWWRRWRPPAAGPEPHHDAADERQHERDDAARQDGRQEDGADHLQDVGAPRGQHPVVAERDPFRIERVAARALGGVRRGRRQARRARPRLPGRGRQVAGEPFAVRAQKQEEAVVRRAADALLHLLVQAAFAALAIAVDEEREILGDRGPHDGLHLRRGRDIGDGHDRHGRQAEHQPVAERQAEGDGAEAVRQAHR